MDTGMAYMPSTDDYYDAIHQATWTRRTAGFLAGTTLGVLFGGTIGAVAAFLPYVISTLGVAGASIAAASPPGAAAIALSAGLFAGISGLMGFAAVATVGADAGAIAAGLAEKEKREVAAQPIIEREPQEKAAEPVPSIFNWKVAAITVPLFAAFGAITALHPATASAVAALGFEGPTLAQPASAAAIAATSSVFGMFGSLIGFKFSYLTNKFSNFYMGIITGKSLSQEPEKEMGSPKTLLYRENGRAIEESSLSQVPEKPFASEKLRQSVQALLNKNDAPASRDVTLTR
ncbi:MAG: hypothetical protein KGJ06_02250 [Pseudomonadota bacterium]|nr:hypothetical protein [Pseudomonadota bacterium]